MWICVREEIGKSVKGSLGNEDIPKGKARKFFLVTMKIYVLTIWLELNIRINQRYVKIWNSCIRFIISINHR